MWIVKMSVRNDYRQNPHMKHYILVFMILFLQNLYAKMKNLHNFKYNFFRRNRYYNGRGILKKKNSIKIHKICDNVFESY